jgi:hypothetical protein
MRGRDDAFIATLTPASLAFVTKAPARASSGWNIQIGARYFYSANRFQKDLGSTTDSAQASTLNSRLTYDTTGNSGRIFRPDRGAAEHLRQRQRRRGGLTNGQLTDEDWTLGRHHPLLEHREPTGEWRH